MRWMFWLTVAAAVGLGFLLLGEPGPRSAGVGAHGVQGGAFGYAGWIGGLLAGVTLAWLARIDWANLPSRLTEWVRLQRRRAGLIMLGGMFAAILLLL